MKTVFLLLVGFVLWKTCESCSCFPKHPQEDYCKSDFAIVATVRRHMRPSEPYELAYRLKIRRKFKMSAKAERALKSGRLVTSKEETMCGVMLKLNETYVITGRVNSLQATVNLCNYVKVWRDVTPRQRKGFRALYKQGCHCEVAVCTGPPSQCKRMSTKKNVCVWDNIFSPHSCIEKHGICLINRKGRCAWARAVRLTDCQLKEQSKKKLTYLN